MAKVLPLHNKHFFQSLHNELVKTNQPMLIDGSGTLWHINDIDDILANSFNLLSHSKK